VATLPVAAISTRGLLEVAGVVMVVAGGDDIAIALGQQVHKV